MRAMGQSPPPRFHLTRYAGVLASNAALRAEVVPGRAKEIERNGVTNDDTQRELFGEERTQHVEKDDREKKPTRHPWAWLLKRVFAVEVLVCVHCAGKLRLVEIAGGGHGDQADNPRRTTPARGARERDGGASTAASTAGSVDVRVSVRETERCCGTSQERSGRRCGGVRPE